MGTNTPKLLQELSGCAVDVSGEVHLLVGLIAPHDADLGLEPTRSKVMIEEMSSLSRFDAPATPRANGTPHEIGVDRRRCG